MRAKSLLLLMGTLLLTGTLVAQQAKGVAAKAKAPGKPDPARTAQIEPMSAMDGDQAYKANCARCHQAPRKFSPRRTATIMRHMRVRANLTEDETEAILIYLTR